MRYYADVNTYRVKFKFYGVISSVSATIVWPLGGRLPSETPTTEESGCKRIKYRLVACLPNLSWLGTFMLCACLLVFILYGVRYNITIRLVPFLLFPLRAVVFLSVLIRMTSGTGTTWWSRAVEIARGAAAEAADAYGILYDSKCRRLLGPIDQVDAVLDSELLKSMVRAAELAAMSYQPISKSSSAEALNHNHPISFGIDNQPDCLVHYCSDDGSMWVGIRGTHNADDVVHDATWIFSTSNIGCLEVPAGVAMRCSSIYTNLSNYLEHLSERDRRQIRRIVFTGHSLGGAISLGMYLSWVFDASVSRRASNLLPHVTAEAITFGSPLVLSQPPPSTMQFELLSRNVHNVVLQLDPVPRLLGAHPLPGYIINTTIGSFVHILMTRNVHRETYRPFGCFYSLRERPSKNIPWGSSSPESSYTAPTNKFYLGRITNPSENLRVFPSNAADFAFSVTRDHSIHRTVNALKKVVEDLRLNE